MSLAQKYKDLTLASGRRVRIWALAWSNPAPQQTYAVQIGGEGPEKERREDGSWRRIKSLEELRQENEILEREIAQYNLDHDWVDLKSDYDSDDGWEIRRKRKERSRSKSKDKKNGK